MYSLRFPMFCQTQFWKTLLLSKAVPMSMPSILSYYQVFWPLVSISTENS